MKERKSTRLAGYNYSSDNLYFVTSCVHNRICCFGEIVGKGRDLSLQRGDLSRQSSFPKMILNEYGLVAENQWYWLSKQYPYVVLHEFVVMPNHIHGILEINRSRIISSDSIKIKSLSELIGAYKTTVSKQIHLLECRERSRPVLAFSWQRSFHDHIIRDEKSLETISDYIFNNPENWEQDNLYNL
jgi:REP element-mobilizing transposase RayT